MAIDHLSVKRQELSEIRDQKSALEGEIVAMQKTADELGRQDGKIKFTVCGNDKRKCAKVNIGMGTFGKGGDNYMILDEY